MKIHHPDFKPSLFNIRLAGSQSKMLVYNSFSGRVAVVDKVYSRQIATGIVEESAKSLPSDLISDGFFVAAETDEMKELALAIEGKKQRECWADITFITSPTSSEKQSEEIVLSEIEQYCLSLKYNPAVQLVKFRICGFATRSIQEREVLFEQLSSSVSTAQKQGVGMWMTNQLTDVLKIGEPIAQAYFFKFDLGKANPPGLLFGKVCLRIKQLVNAGKAVMIQIETRNVSDIEKHSGLLKQLALALSKLNPQLMNWDLAIRDNSCPVYYRPESCDLPDIEFEKNKLECKRSLARLGIRLLPQIRRIHVQPGCPFLQENHKTFWWTGEVSTCLRQLPTPEHEYLGTQKLKNPTCRQCAYLPTCAALCPLTRETVDCDTLKQVFNMNMVEGNLDFCERN